MGVRVTTAKISVSDQIEVLTQQTIRARLYYEIWWFYAGADTRPGILETLNRFPDFFRFDAHAQFVAMIVHCGTILDSGDDVISLATLARAPLLDPKRFPADAELVDRIGAAITKSQGLRTVRHKAIVHRSGEFDYSNAFAKANLIPDDIPVLLGEVLDLVNELRKRKRMNLAHFSSRPLEDTMRLIHALGGPDLRPRSWIDDILSS